MLLPDEGLIHAWLDEQLPPDEAMRVEQLVATDTAWAAAAAEARGLIAASSRIVSALDHVPAGVVPKGTTRPAVRRLPWWTKVAAALVLVAGATSVVLQHAPKPAIATVPKTESAPQAQVVEQPSAMPAATPSPAAMRSPVPTRSPVPKPILAAKTPMQVAATDASQKPAMTDSSVAQREEKAAASPTPGGVDAMRERSNAARRDVAGAMTSRTSAEAGAVKAFASNAAARPGAPQVVGGIPMEQRVPSTARPGACYRLHDSRTLADVGTVMRISRVEGDTLRLESAQVPSPLRAWVVLRDSTARGVLTTAPEGRGMVLVTALPVSCPSP
jgi:anti-sigma factor RsiW